MKRNYFIFELFKSAPFILLMVLTLMILLGIYLSDRHQHTVKMKEDVIYVTPRPGN